MSTPTSGTLPSLEDSTPDNDGPTVVVVGYIFLVFCMVVMLGRVATSLTKKRKLEPEDAFLTLAVVFAVAQTVVTERAVDAGLGRYMHKLNANQISSYYKLLYTSEILSLFPMALSKFAVIWLVRRIPGDRSMERPCFIASIAVLVWTVFSFFALVFQCGANHPWVYAPQKCAGGIWYAVVVLNVISDAVLSVFFAPTLWKLQTSRSQRLKVISLFAIRIVVCATGIVQLVFISSAINSNDQTRSRVTFTILNQLVMCLSIICSAAPSLYRSVADLHSRMGLQIPDAHVEMYNSASKTAGKSHVRALKSSSKAFSRNQSKNRSQTGTEEKGTTLDSEEHFSPGGDGTASGRVEHDPGFNAETGSRASDGSEQMIIRQTTAWDVRYEDH